MKKTFFVLFALTAVTVVSWPKLPIELGKLPKYPMASNLSAMPSWPAPLMSWPSTPSWLG